MPPNSEIGSSLTAPAASTPGAVRSRARMGSNSASRRAAVETSRSKDSCAVTTWLGSRPLSTPVSRAKLRSNSPAPTTSATVSATSAPSSTRRARPPVAVAPRPPATFTASPRSGRAASSAGQSPKPTPVSSASTAVNASTRRSTVGDTTPARDAGIRWPTSRSPAGATTRPAAVPPNASITLSTSNWRTIRIRGGAEQRPHRNLTPPLGRPGEQEVRDVCAGDEQEHGRGAQEHEERFALIPDQAGAHRLEKAHLPDLAEGLAEPPAPAGIAGRHGRRKSVPEVDHARVSRRIAHPVVHPGDDLHGDVAAHPVIVARHRIREGNPEVAFAREVEPARHDADHGVRLSGEGDHAVQHRPSAERVSPERIRQHHDGRAVRLSLVGGEPASQEGRHAHRRKEVERHLAGLHADRMAGFAEVHAAALVLGHVREGAGHRCDVVEIRRLKCRRRVAVGVGVREADAVHEHQPVGMREKGQRPNIAASTALNIAVVAPTPSASTITTAAVNPGRWRAAAARTPRPAPDSRTLRAADRAGAGCRRRA